MPSWTWRSKAFRLGKFLRAFRMEPQTSLLTLILEELRRLPQKKSLVFQSIKLFNTREID